MTETDPHLVPYHRPLHKGSRNHKELLIKLGLA